MAARPFPRRGHRARYGMGSEGLLRAHQPLVTHRPHPTLPPTRPLQADRIAIPKWKQRGPTHRQADSGTGTLTTNTSQANSPAAGATQGLAMPKALMEAQLCLSGAQARMRVPRPDATGRDTPRHAKARHAKDDGETRAKWDARDPPFTRTRPRRSGEARDRRTWFRPTEPQPS